MTTVATLPKKLTANLSGRARMLLADLIAAADSDRVPDSAEQDALRRRLHALPGREQRRLERAFHEWQEGVGAGPVARIAPAAPSRVDAAGVWVAGIAPHAQDQAEEDYDAGELASFLSAPLADPEQNDALALVVRNAGDLAARGLFERGLVQTFRSGYTGWPPRTVAWLFALADPARLRACGHALPEGDQFTVYRGGNAGVALSWSRDPKVAAYFASLNQSSVIRRATVTPADVRCYFASAASGVRLPWLSELSDEWILPRDPGGEALDEDEVDVLMDAVA